jgi:hypothetical protein
MLLEAREQSLQRRLDVADRPDRDRMAPADMSRIEIDLDDLRLVGIELVQAKSAPSRSSTSQPRTA